MRASFTNRPRGKDFTINFFHLNAPGIKSAQLACPFFTDANPITILKSAGCERIQLLVRLCEVTSPDALASARAVKGVDIRFFTAPEFHAKFYILGQRALVGSANLTDGGLTRNRELSVVVDAEDEIFDDIPSLFDELWNSANVLTDDALKRFKLWRQSNSPKASPPIEGIERSSPVTIIVSTQTESRTRTFLETFRAFYVENLIPSHRIVEQIYSEREARHPAFAKYPYEYEIDRFLYWVRGLTTEEEIELHPVRTGEDLRGNIRDHVTNWFSVQDTGLKIDFGRLRHIEQLQELFSDDRVLADADMDSMVEALQGCAAFVEMLRFTEGGLENHIRAFKRDNPLESVKACFQHLAFGPGEYVQRIYDCIYLPKYKLLHWGRNCTFELFGWINKHGVPPFNGRIIKALRCLGFDVKI